MSKESDWTNETGEDDDDMEYEPTAEEEGEDMRDMSHLLEEEVDEDDDQEYHGIILCISYIFHALIMIRCRTGLHDDGIRR